MGERVFLRQLRCNYSLFIVTSRTYATQWRQDRYPAAMHVA